MKVLCPFTVVFAIGLGLALTGCGGGSSPSSASLTSTEPITSTAEPGTPNEPTRASVIEEGDAICSDFKIRTASLNEELEEVAGSDDLETPRQEVKLAELLTQVTEMAEDEKGELEGLEPPSEDASIINRYIERGGEGLAKLEESVHALEEGVGSQFAELFKEGIALNQQAHGIAQGYGFKVCGSEE